MKGFSSLYLGRFLAITLGRVGLGYIMASSVDAYPPRQKQIPISRKLSQQTTLTAYLKGE